VTARLYEVTVAELRNGFTKTYVQVFLIAAETRAKAEKEAVAASYTEGADAVVTKVSCIGRHYQKEYRVLREPQA